MSVIESLRKLKKQTLLKLSDIYSVATLKKTGTLDVEKYMDRVKGIGEYSNSDEEEDEESEDAGKTEEELPKEEETQADVSVATKSSRSKKTLKL